MRRKISAVEMAGGKTPRQRIWDTILYVVGMNPYREKFTQLQIQECAQTTPSMTEKYLRLLEVAGFIKCVDEKTGIKAVDRYCAFNLVKHNGIEAPRLNKNGELVTEASITERMWNTMRRLFKNKSFNSVELASFASTTESKVSQRVANKYIAALLAAGYLQQVESKTGRRFLLLQAMDSGRRAPIMQINKVVYDPNWNRVVWVEEKGAQDE